MHRKDSMHAMPCQASRPQPCTQVKISPDGSARSASSDAFCTSCCFLLIRLLMVAINNGPEALPTASAHCRRQGLGVDVKTLVCSECSTWPAHVRPTKDRSTAARGVPNAWPLHTSTHTTLWPRVTHGGALLSAHLRRQAPAVDAQEVENSWQLYWMRKLPSWRLDHFVTPHLDPRWMLQQRPASRLRRVTGRPQPLNYCAVQATGHTLLTLVKQAQRAPTLPFCNLRN
jgi:hypothetical protein